LFRGAPDITKNDKKKIMVASHRDGGDVSESSLSSEDELVENSNQQNPLQGAVTALCLKK